MAYPQRILFFCALLPLTGWADDSASTTTPSSSSEQTVSEPYNPERIDMTKTSSLASKSYTDSSSNLAGQKLLDDDKNRTFQTTTFDTSLAQPSSLQNRATTVSPTTVQTMNSKAGGFDKTFASSTYTANQTSSLSNQLGSDLQNKTSSLQANPTFATSTNSTLQVKPFVPETPDDSSVLEKKKNDVLTRMSTVPNRPLSIEEVRDLINRGVAPYGDKPKEDANKSVEDGSNLIVPSSPSSAPQPSPAPQTTSKAEKQDGDKNNN